MGLWVLLLVSYGIVHKYPSSSFSDLSNFLKYLVENFPMMSYISRCSGISITDLMFCSSSSIIPIAHGIMCSKLDKCVLDEWRRRVDSSFHYDERCWLSTHLITDDCFKFTFRDKTALPSVLNLALHCSRVRLLLVMCNRALNWCSCIKLASATLPGSNIYIYEHVH